MSKAVFNIDELIKFYDLKGENHKHASSVTGLIGEDLITGIFKHYLESKSPKPKVNVLTENPKEKNGRWLDRWMGGWVVGWVGGKVDRQAGWLAGH